MHNLYVRDILSLCIEVKDELTQPSHFSSSSEMQCAKISEYHKCILQQVGGFKTVRDRSSSAAVGGTMVVLGGRGDNGDGVVSIEMFNR